MLALSARYLNFVNTLMCVKFPQCSPPHAHRCLPRRRNRCTLRTIAWKFNIDLAPSVIINGTPGMYIGHVSRGKSQTQGFCSVPLCRTSWSLVFIFSQKTWNSRSSFPLIPLGWADYQCTTTSKSRRSPDYPQTQLLCPIPTQWATSSMTGRTILVLY